MGFAITNAGTWHGRNDDHLEDALIAATALVRDLTVATRNTDDFKPFGVSLINPFLTPRWRDSRSAAYGD